MHRTLFPILSIHWIFLATLPLAAQTARVQWRSEVSVGESFLTHVHEARDGSFTIAADTESAPIVARLDRFGTVLREIPVTIAGHSTVALTSSTALPSGGVVLCGFSERPPRSLVAALDASGETLWSHEADEFTFFANVAVLSDGGVLVVGARLVFEPGGDPFETASGVDALILRLDARGDVIFERTIGTEREVYDASVAMESRDGSLLVSGLAFTEQGSDTVFVMRLDRSGAIISERHSPAPQFSFILDIAEADDGTIALAAESSLHGFDPDGEPVWTVELARESAVDGDVITTVQRSALSLTAVPGGRFMAAGRFSRSVIEWDFGDGWGCFGFGCNPGGGQGPSFNVLEFSAGVLLTEVGPSGSARQEVILEHERETGAWIRATRDGGAVIATTPLDEDGLEAAGLAIVKLAPFSAAPSTPRFRRGDVNGSGALELTDAIVALGYLFQGGATPRCLDAVDADDSGTLSLTDPVWILNHLFQGGAPPAEPFEQCGTDRTADPLDCLVSDCR